MAYIFTPPKVPHGSIGVERLFQFYEAEAGLTVMLFGDEYVEVLYPSEDDMALADKVYRPAANQITDDEAYDLTEAGYGEYIIEVE